MFNDEILAIDNNLRKILNTYDTLKEEMTYALLPGGKRLRALLVVLILEDLNIDYTQALDIACAIEMIHTYSLIHDDLPSMDNDDMRRGKPSMHIKYGENIAILTGDSLLTESFYWIANSNINPESKAKIIKIVSKLSGARGMVKGQVLDLQTNINSYQELVNIHLHKTKDLIEAAIMSAAIIANFEKDFFKDIAFYLGMGFQIKDDIDDDSTDDNSSILKFVSVERANEILKEYKNKCLELIANNLGKKKMYMLVENII